MDPFGSASWLPGGNSWWNGGGLLVVIVVVVVKSFVDGHNFGNGWWLLDGVVGFEDLVVVGVIPRFGIAVPGKGLLLGIVSKSGFCDKIDTQYGWFS